MFAGRKKGPPLAGQRRFNAPKKCAKQVKRGPPGKVTANSSSFGDSHHEVDGLPILLMAVANTLAGATHLRLHTDIGFIGRRPRASPRVGIRMNAVLADHGVIRVIPTASLCHSPQPQQHRPYESQLRFGEHRPTFNAYLEQTRLKPFPNITDS
jgi:hypothetical protein